jgi:hypothetical protein
MKSKYKPSQALSLDPEGKSMEFTIETKVIPKQMYFCVSKVNRQK